MDIRGRARRWLRSDEAPVLLTAVVVAIPTAWTLQALVPGAAFEFGFLALLAVGVGVPRVYERWPVRYPRGYAVLWTLGVTFLVAGELAVVYLLVLTVADPLIAAIVAFVLTDLGNVFLVMLLFGGAEDDRGAEAAGTDPEDAG